MKLTSPQKGRWTQRFQDIRDLVRTQVISGMSLEFREDHMTMMWLEEPPGCLQWLKSGLEEVP